VGAAFLKLHLDQAMLDTAATIGIKGWNIGTGDDTQSYLAFPVEVAERLAVQQVRFGVGLNFALSPRIRGDGLAAAEDYDFDTVPGLVVQAEWIGRRRPGQFGGMIGVRYLVQKLKETRTGASVDASTFGFTLGIEYGDPGAPWRRIGHAAVRRRGASAGRCAIAGHGRPSSCLRARQGGRADLRFGERSPAGPPLAMVDQRGRDPRQARRWTKRRAPTFTDTNLAARGNKSASCRRPHRFSRSIQPPHTTQPRKVHSHAS